MTDSRAWPAFNADRLAILETRMWKAYYRRQPARLFGLLVLALREQARTSWPRAVAAALLLTRAAIRFARAEGEYDRFAPDIARGYRLLRLPAGSDVEAAARWELRWWVVRREIGLSAGEAAGEAIANVYAAFYGVPRERVAEAGRLRGLAAELRDRGAAADPEGPRAAGRAYWPEVARLLRQSYRSLQEGLRATAEPGRPVAERSAEPVAESSSEPVSPRPDVGRPATTQPGTAPPPGAASGRPR